MDKLKDAIKDLEIKIIEKRKELKELSKQLKELKNTYYTSMLDVEKIERKKKFEKTKVNYRWHS